ncbi:sulfatase-like hydrolase/transferase [Pseudoalteromonas haloplanktis]|uniref:Sulfatase-like hydrolase/transferase n=1 Tax=Pseudoalteromonas haloplanktis TaxID=228 RepID=A0ABU1B7H3_PSEHA|nr:MULTISPECIES: sulfatase-like hydrolase/transferase [Pseudoalteromonas]MDQ9090358.1 sulfatase-like hydrolase/transferase [Pseudoalteromonas haloplanktis]TMN74111.1 sulfatase [Pseudoalteromonas sp. S1727]
MIKKLIQLALLSCVALNAHDILASELKEDSVHKKPNVLILMFDDMRFDTFSYRNGPVSTPNIDALAQQGTRFDQAMTSTGLCSPSRAAMFTGRWGHKTGLDDNVELYHSRLSELSLSEGGLIKRAADAGYNVSYVGKWHLGAQGPALRGADFMWGHDKDTKRHARQWAPYETQNNVDRMNAGERDANGEKHDYYKTLPGSYEDTVTAKEVNEGKKMLRQAAASKQPFFGIVSFEQPHPPYRVPEPYASMFDYKKVKLPKNFGVKRVNKPMSQDGIWWPWHDVSHMTEDDWRKAHSFYYGAIAMIDHAVGELIQTAKDVGLYDDLHIVLVGDQGSMLGEHDLYDKGPYAYDELMRMPLIIRDPALQPRIINRQVSMLDIAPTLSQWMALPTDGDVDGRSLLGLMEKGDIADEGRDDTALYAYEWYNGGWFGIRAIRTPTMKFVWNPGDSRDELYDLVNDPYEITNEIKNPKYKKQLGLLVKKMASELARVEDPSLEKFQQHMNAFL